MKLSEYIEAVKTLCVEIHGEDMDGWETSGLDKRIILAANMGGRDIARSTFPLMKSVTESGPGDWEPPADLIRLQHYEGGHAERYIGEDGREHLRLTEEGPYRITYSRAPKTLTSVDQEIEFPDDVINALIYFGAQFVLSSDNDKRSFVYFKNLYDQECVNIIANRPSRLTVVKEKRGGMRVL